MLSALALFLSLWLATMPVAFMFSVGDCCGCGGCNDGGSFGAIGDCCSTAPTNVDVTIPNVFTNHAGGCDQCPSIGATYTLAAGSTGLICSGVGHGYTPGTQYEYKTTNFCLNGTAPFTFQSDLLITAVFTCQSNNCYIIVTVTIYDQASQCWSDWRWVTTFARNTACNATTFTVPYGSALDYGGGPWCDISGSPGDVSAVGY